jgi:hypothetical protein
MHREVLTRRAAELFPSLAKFAGFYLAGGTGLAVQIGHRVSVDFDLFCRREIKRTLLPRLEAVFAGAASITPLVNNPDELTALVDGIKVTFLNYPFPVVDPLEDCEGVPVLSVRENRRNEGVHDRPPRRIQGLCRPLFRALRALRPTR